MTRCICCDQLISYLYIFIFELVTYIYHVPYLHLWMNLSLCHKCCVPIDLSTQLVAKLKLRVKVKNNQIRKYMDKHISCIYTVGHKIERPPEWRISCIYTVSCEIKRPPEWKDNQIRKYMDKCISCIYTQSVVNGLACQDWHQEKEDSCLALIIRTIPVICARITQFIRRQSVQNWWRSS